MSRQTFEIECGITVTAGLVRRALKQYSKKFGGLGFTVKGVTQLPDTKEGKMKRGTFEIEWSEGLITSGILGILLRQQFQRTGHPKGHIAIKDVTPLPDTQEDNDRYRVIMAPVYPMEAERLNELAAEGWRLISIVRKRDTNADHYRELFYHYFEKEPTAVSQYGGSITVAIAAKFAPFDLKRLNEWPANGWKFVRADDNDGKGQVLFRFVKKA